MSYTYEYDGITINGEHISGIHRFVADNVFEAEDHILETFFLNFLSCSGVLIGSVSIIYIDLVND